MTLRSLLIGISTVVCIASAAAAKPANQFDGTWTETITGETANCAGSVNASFHIVNSRMAEPNATGMISPNGSARGTARGGGFTATWMGRFTETTASGRFKRNDGCVGRWEARKQ